ncbi:alpha/beta hydrolase [Sporichthya sp.]|uniref:alpha/beta hydrolase n=1 Tax=Sporichthya sp. TaxID=65475 RepID=UPI0017DFA97F|nr:alpha/beta hydrolase [Sporichthya sp.]MBA3743064.1 alpha/beta hydrolase [Sporichthya sp.]
MTAALMLTTGITGEAAHGASAGSGSAAVAQGPATKIGGSSTKQGVLKRSYQYYSQYGNATTLDVYMPKSAVGKRGLKLPTVVLVHGGAWTMGSRADRAPQANQLARKGFIAVAVNYRLATEAAWPAQRLDVSRAVTFLRKNAEYFNIDKSKMGLFGSSAGGQIAAAVATHGNGKQRFKGLVVLSGLLNPATIAQENPEYSDSVVPDKLIGCDLEDCPERYLAAIPARALNRSDMPSLLFHSQDEDPFGPAQSAEFVSRSRSVGVPSKLKMLKGDEHGIEYWDRVNDIVIAWFENHLK